MAGIHAHDGAVKADSSSRGSKNNYSIWVRIEPDGRRKLVHGRMAWFLKELISRGKSGCTTFDYPGVRISDSCFKLRREGFVIETIYESHTGPFPGNHGRYVLHSKVTVLEDCKAAA